jgi:hypothetical protein
MMRNRLVGLIALSVIQVGCSSGASTGQTEPAAERSAQLEPSAASKPAEVSDMPKPFMFGEAKLPKGFPPPGPVGEIIIKQYPQARAAVVRAAATPGAESQDSLFMPLFNHIKTHQIAMSAPVEMTYSSTASKAGPQAMAFFYTDTTIGTLGKEGRVEVMDVPPAEYLSIGVRGSYSGNHFQTALCQLKAWLEQHPGYKVAGFPRYLGYNSPLVPWFMRYGEVQLPIEGIGG